MVNGRRSEGHQPAPRLSWGGLEDAIGPRVRQLRNLMTQRNLDALADHDLPTGSLSMMCLIHANPGCSQTDIADAAGINKSAAVALIDQLEKSGLAQRIRSPEDRRRNDLVLTATGTEAMDRMIAHALEGEKPLRDALSDQELAQLRYLLDTAHAALANRQTP